MPVRPARSTAEVSSSMEQNAFSSDHIFERLHLFMARPRPGWGGVESRAHRQNLENNPMQSRMPPVWLSGGLTTAFHPALACEAPEFRRLLRMPPAAANDDALGHDLAVADQMLADSVDIVELALLDGDEGGISSAARLEAAEFGTPQRHRRIVVAGALSRIEASREVA